MKRWLPAVFLFFFLSPVVSYSDSNVIEPPHVKAELVSEVSFIQPSSIFWVGIWLKIDEGWHIYWKNPGDSGLEPSLSWSLPPGFSAGKIHWPFPEFIKSPPLVSYGYEDEVLLLVPVTAPDSLKDGFIQRIQGRVNWLVCKEDCIPGGEDLQLDLPVKAKTEPSRWSQKFAEARAKLPVASPSWKVQAFSSAKEFHLSLSTMENGASPGNIYFFPEASNLIDHAALQRMTGQGNHLELDIKRSKLMKDPPKRISGVLVSQNGWQGFGSARALQVDVPVGVWASHEEARMNGVLAVLFAFLGGLILNGMPCVLPVLSLKILGLAAQSGISRRERLIHGLLYTAGILLSFWILSGLLISLRLGGGQVGWGFQLQSPVFLIFLIFFFLFFSLNLLGLYEIGLSLTRLGSLTHESGGGAFISGVLAVIVATPCTAPFMGAALGFALFQPIPVAFLIFTALALGLAFPYLMFCIYPQWTAWMPKPGKWMIGLKQFLGMILFAVVLWFIYLLTVRSSHSELALFLSGIWLFAAGVWFFSGYQPGSQENKLQKWIPVFLILAGFFLAASPQFPFMRQIDSGKFSQIEWEPFSSKRLESLLSQGKPVFIDFTAEWCLSCKVNEKIALESKAVVKAFREQSVTALKADWTKQDDEITEALQKYGRSSIPLYVLYLRGNDGPILLPELLTPEMVLKALNKSNPQGEKNEAR